MARRGFTIVEMMVALMAAIVVLATAWTLFVSTARTGKKSQELSAAVQAAAQLLHDLELDFANVVPQPLRDGTVAIDEATPGVKRLGILRANTARGMEVGFDAPDVMPARPAVQVWYAAIKNSNTEPYELMRYGDGSVTRFAGARASEVSFRFIPDVAASEDAPVADARENFVRVALLVIGEGNPEETGMAAPKPCLMTALYHVPRPPAPLDQ